jgi:hypothetical protein
MTEPVIFIRPVPFGVGFDVTVEPAPADGVARDREFPELKAARGYASGLRLTQRWPIHDQTGEVA